MAQGTATPPENRPHRRDENSGQNSAGSGNNSDSHEFMLPDFNNNPYDKEKPDSDKRGLDDLGPGHHEPSGDSSDSRGAAANPRELEDAESNEGGFYNKNGDGNKARSSNVNDLRNSEESNNGMYNESGDEPKGGLKGAYGKYKNGRGRYANLKGRLSKNKWLVGFGLSGIAGIIGFLILFFLFIGSLKIPDFVEHVTAYQFNRVTNEYAQSAEEVTGEELAIQSADDSTYAQLKDQYQNLRDNTWGRLDNLRPGIVIKNLKADNNLNIVYQRSGILGRQRLKGITIDNTTYLVKNVSGPWKYVPGLKNVLQLKNQTDFANVVFPRLNAGLELDSVSPLIRGIVENNIRKEAGISLVAYTASKFNGETPEQAQLTEERGAYDAITQEQQASQLPKSEDLKNATQEAEQQEQTDVASDSTLQKILNNGGVDPNVSTILQNTFSSNTLTTALGYVNPAIGVGTPLCLVYDGSLENAGPTIDEQTKQEQRSYYYIASAASQQKTGSPAASAEATGALNTKLGDITQSNAEIRASGGTPNTNNTLSGEASAGGQYTIFDAILPGVAQSVLDFAANNVCPVLTNTAGIVGVSILSLVAALATGGTSAGAEESANAGAESFLGSFASNIFSRFGLDRTAAVSGKVGDILTDTVKTGGKIAGATIIARMIVAADANYEHNGLEQNTDFTNEADAGGNFTANQLDQQLNYGRPLTCQEVNASDQQSTESLAAATASESTYERYADIENPDSLANHMAIEASAYIKPSTFVGQITGWANDIFKPMQSTVGLLTSSHLLAYAAPSGCANDDSTDYGNVQFGWPQSEEDLINSSPTYQYLENKSILDNSGEEDNIASTYGECFTDSIGTLLSKGDIVRDADGNVLDQGLCSPTNLGPNNPQYGDMVFRWRLDKRYSNALDQMTSEQTVETSDDTPTTPTPTTAPADTGTLPTGSSQDLAKQLQSYIQQGKLFCGAAAGGTESADCSDIQNTANGTPVGGNCQVTAITPHLLGLILGLEQEGWTLGISAMCSDHHVEGNTPYSGHSYGTAADFSVQEKDGKTYSGVAASNDEDFVNDAAALLSSTGGSFGQVAVSGTVDTNNEECHLPYASEKASNFTLFADDCTHQHIRAAP